MSKPLGPYTPVVRAGDLVVVSGQGGVKDGVLVDGVAAQARQAIANAKALLAEQGAQLTDVFKTMCFLTDMGTFAEFNEGYMDAFGDHRPARSTVGVNELPGGFRVEIEMWAHAPAK